MKTEIITTINKVQILATENENLIPIRPLCDAVGIDAKAQRNRIERDEILSSVGVMTTSTGADGKQYEMLCLPLKYIFGWLFSIDDTKVREEARAHVLHYKMQCYNALYDHFFGTQKRLIEQNRIEIALLEELSELNQKQITLKQEIADKRKDLQQIRDERLKNEPTLFD